MQPTMKQEQKPFGIDFPFFEEDQDYYHFYFETLLQDLQHLFLDLDYIQSDEYSYFNGLFNLNLETTYHGDGLVIRLEPHTEVNINIYNLAVANHSRSYERIKRALMKQGYTLRIATSGYTSSIVTNKPPVRSNRKPLFHNL